MKQQPLLYTMEEAAKELRISRRYLQDLLLEYPFYRMIGRRKVFTPGDLKKIVEALPRPSTPAPPRNRRTSTYTSRASRTAYDEAMELLDRRADEAKR